MPRESKDADYRMRVITGLSDIAPASWNAMAGSAPGAVFVRHEWLAALESSGCVGGASGWQPLHALLEDGDGKVLGATPLYAKEHSYGEYVFDWAWADAYRRHGLDYYPKLLSAVPFTPIAGARLLVAPDADPASVRTALATGLRQRAEHAGLSSVHVLFPDTDARAALQTSGYSLRHGVQFHWHNQGFESFEAFLAALSQPKRKKIRAERRKVRDAGVHCERRIAGEITDSDWRFFVRCYNQTYLEHHSTPYLNLAFFQRVAQTMPEAFIMIIASVDGERVAASLLVRDETRIYGRYWGALAWISHMHFEVAYYQTIEAAIALNIAVIEGGAQGEHKMARGFLPVPTCSAHWLAEPAFADAVDNFLERESLMMGGYMSELQERQPFRDSIGARSDDAAG